MALLQTAFELHGDGKRLRVARLGSGPALILLHGYPDNLQIWSELAPRLAERFTVIAFDWPGMGYSEPWRGGTTPAHMAARLLKLLDEWQIEQVGLVGMDMGGQPALTFAANYPGRMRELVVMNSLLFWDEKTSWEIQIMRQFGWNRFILRRLPGIVFWRAESTFLPARVWLPPDLRKDFWDSFKQPEVRVFINRMCAGYQGTLSNLPELYRRVICPTLILWSQKDTHFPIAHAERLHALIRSSKLQVVPGAEHWMAWYRADEVAEFIHNQI